MNVRYVRVKYCAIPGFGLVKPVGQYFISHVSQHGLKTMAPPTSSTGMLKTNCPNRGNGDVLDAIFLRILSQLCIPVGVRKKRILARFPGCRHIHAGKLVASKDFFQRNVLTLVNSSAMLGHVLRVLI
jgi:hypothetical protein